MKSFLLYKEDLQIEQNGTNAFIIFETDALRFSLEYTITNIIDGNYPHVGITAREGLSVLCRKHKSTGYSSWYPVDLLSKVYKIEVNMSHIIKKNEIYEILIYGPILAHLSSLICLLNDEDYFQIPIHTSKKKCLLLGGAKTFGIGITSTSMIFGNILQREMLDRLDFTRMAFQENNFLSLLTSQLKETDLSGYNAIILEADNYRQDDSIVRQCLPILLELISKKVELVICWHALPPNASKKTEQVTTLISEQKGENISYLNFNQLFSPEFLDLCTYSVNFINDAGNIRIYKSLKPALEKLWSI